MEAVVSGRLPFVYESTGAQTFFTDYRDPDPRARDVFAFHRPETLRAWASEPSSLRTRLRQMPLEQFQLGFTVAQQFLRSSKPPTAVIALTDVIAVGALHAAWKAGFSVPRDLSVTGFDDISLARYTMPELTTATQPVFEMGKQAALRLLRRIQKPDLKVRRTLLPIGLVIRGSTAPARLL